MNNNDLGQLEHKLQKGKMSAFIYIGLILILAVVAIIAKLDMIGLAIIGVAIIVFIYLAIQSFIESKDYLELFQNGLTFSVRNDHQTILYRDITSIDFKSEVAARSRRSTMHQEFAYVTISNSTTVRIPWPGLRQVLEQKLSK